MTIITFSYILLSSELHIHSKAHMDQILAQAKVEVLATSKQWEPQRAYEKRLSTVMSKDKGKHTRHCLRAAADA